MLEYKYPEYENYRLLDDVEKYLFIYENSLFVNDNSGRFLPLCEMFEFFFNHYDRVTGSGRWSDHSRLPNKWRRTKAALSIFDRIVEDQIRLDLLEGAGGTWTLLAEIYNDYQASLSNHRRCDFAHLQQKFLDFLETPLGRLFLGGNNTDMHPGIQYVMVDEYQDTNPIQESLYFELARDNHNLCVVGDDDQALYRFRGGTVDCMVTFDQACNREWDISFEQEWKKFLSTNYRSHPDIVGYYDRYISSFEVMRLTGARVQGKPRLTSGSRISGDYPAVAFLSGSTIQITATRFAELVRGLISNNIIQNPSQCALLMRSVKESERYAGPFAQALRDVGIMPYNPRSRTFLDQEEIKGALGAFISIIDPGLSALGSVLGEGIQIKVQDWIDEYNEIITRYPQLSAYVTQSIANIRRSPINSWLNVGILDIFYRILAHEPFTMWKNDPERTYRLGKLSKLFEAYSAVPYPTSLGSNRGHLKISSTEAGEISFRWRQNFYYSFTGLLVSEGLNDPEDEEIIAPPDRFPIMTVHQAKGLEFDFVFVYGINQNSKIDDSLNLEDMLSRFRQKSSQNRFSREQRANQDLIRYHFVSYSRAKSALIHIIPKSHFKNDKYGFINKSTREFRAHARSLGG